MDNKVVLTGSANLTDSHISNVEHMTRITEARVVNDFLDDFNYIYNKAAVVDASDVRTMSEKNFGLKTAALLKTFWSSAEELAAIADTDADAASSSIQPLTPDKATKEKPNEVSSESESESQKVLEDDIKA